MVYVQSAVAPRTIEFSQKATRTKPNVLRRLLDAVAESNMRKAEREIARYLNGPGAKFTDETEREIERRFMSNQNW